ncbi:LptF/LptG family permease [Ferruginibacter yonginensis]|uniref:LptF/LptG family permease n=1 Tax=Ferruginibacter yonginensis TaxID=1310416 RepID=A0ABV8QV76_9BACT
MKLLDKYILSKYLTTFFFCIILFTAIVVVVDISEKTDDFTKSQLSAYRIMVDYYFGFIPRIDALLFPLFVFISVIFFTSKMAGRSEVIAILSSGVTFRRFLMPFLAGGFILASLLWLGYQYVVPNANKKWGDFEKKYIDVNTAEGLKNTSYKQNLYFKIDKDSYVGIRGYDTISKTGNGFFYQKFKGNQLLFNLRAANFNWDTAKNKWRLVEVTERTIQPIDELVVNTPEKFANYNFKPIDLRRDNYLKDQMVTSDLNEFIKREKVRGSDMLSTLLVERYNRDAIPASVIILTIIGATLASRKVRGGSGAHIAIGVVLSMTYILFSRFSVVFATKGNFTPFLAAWLPNILFGILAFVLYRRAAK